MRRIAGRRSREGKLAHLSQEKVHAVALETLREHLTLLGRGESSEPELVFDVLLAAAAKQSSIEQECLVHPQAPCANTVRGVLRRSLRLEQLEDELNALLAAQLEERYWQQPQSVAVDLVEVPYHGEVASDEAEIRGGKAKSGTTHFHVYATAYVLREGRRVTLALHYVLDGESHVEVLDALKRRLDELGIEVDLWLADRAFCHVAALRWFSAQPEAIVPLPLRGNSDPPSASRALAQARHSHWTRYTMNSPTAGSFEFDVAVVRRRRQRSRGTRRPRPPVTLLYAVVGTRLEGGTFGRSLQLVADLYQSRFGIESSYRQMNQGRLRTSSRSPALRLLAVGLALLLRNLWVLLGWMSTAHRGAGRRSTKRNFRLRTLLEWIADVIKQRLGFIRMLHLPAPSELRF